MSKFWAMAFLLWFAGHFTLELLAFWVVPNNPIWYLYSFLAFLCIEIPGATKKRENGDTFSETLWQWNRKGYARVPLAACICVALALRMISLPFILSGLTASGFFIFAPYVLIGLGLMAWLYLHITRQGEFG